MWCDAFQIRLLDLVLQVYD